MSKKTSKKNPEQTTVGQLVVGDKVVIDGTQFLVLATLPMSQVSTHLHLGLGHSRVSYMTLTNATPVARIGHRKI